MSSYWNTAESLLLGEVAAIGDEPAFSEFGENREREEYNKVQTQSVAGTSKFRITEHQREELLSPVKDEQISIDEKIIEDNSDEGEINDDQPVENVKLENIKSDTIKSHKRKRGATSKGRRGRKSFLPPAIAEGLARHEAVQQKFYKQKYKQMKSFAELLVLENAAFCDEVAEVQQKIIIASEERRFLLNKLRAVQQTSNKDTGDSSDKVLTPIDRSHSEPVSVSRKTQPTLGRSHSSGRITKAKRLCPPITLDSAGRPIFPIILGPLTVHSLGEIVSEKSNYHRPHVIYPVGFCSSRTYASVTKPTQSATYTCKVLDGGLSPRFELVCEDPEDGMEKVFSGNSPADCLSQVINVLNTSKEMPNGILVTRPDTGTISDRGLRFFGLSHPSVQNVLQACPGARKCTSYQWIKFEVCKSETEVDNVLQFERDAGLCHEVLLRNIMFATHALG